MYVGSIKMNLKNLLSRLMSSSTTFLVVLLMISNNQGHNPCWLQLLLVQTVLFSMVISFVYYGLLINQLLIVLRAVAVGLLFVADFRIIALFSIMLEFILQRNAEFEKLRAEKENVLLTIAPLSVQLAIGVFIFLRGNFYLLPLVFLGSGVICSLAGADPRLRKPLIDLINPTVESFRRFLSELWSPLNSFIAYVGSVAIIAYFSSQIIYFWILLATWAVSLLHAPVGRTRWSLSQLIIPVGMLGFTIILIFGSNLTAISDTSYGLIYSFSGTVIAGIAVFNTASLFVVMQLNYQKFGSMRVVTNLLRQTSVITCITIPFVCVVFLFESAYYLPNNGFVMAMLLYFCLLSCLGLFVLFNSSLENVVVVNRLLRSISKDDIRDDEMSTITTFETKIDSASLVCNALIAKGDRFTASKIVPFVVIFLKKSGLEFIYEENFHQRRQNKVLHFSEEFQNAIVLSNQKIVTEAVRDCFRIYLMSDIKIDTIEQNRFVYTFLSELIVKFLPLNQEGACSILVAYLHRIGDLFLSIDESQLTGSKFEEHGSRIWAFDEYILKPLFKTVSVALEIGANEYLKRLDIVDDLFSAESPSELSFHVQKIEYLLLHYRHAINNKNVYLAKNRIYGFHYEQDYSSLFPIENHRLIGTKGAFSKYEKYFVDFVMGFFHSTIPVFNAQNKHMIDLLVDFIRSALNADDRKIFLLMMTLASSNLDQYFRSISDFDKHLAEISELWYPFLDISRLASEGLPRTKYYLVKVEKIKAKLTDKYNILSTIMRPTYRFNAVSGSIPMKDYRLRTT